jgi:hypothetical protein
VAVVLRQDQGIDQIVAFIVREDNHAENTVASMATQSDAEFGAGLRGILSALLPPYMVPSRFEFMNEVPRLTSGKIDRNELKRCVLQAVVASGESDVAESATEEVLFSALASLFPGQTIRRNADFFNDLGGHSLMAAKLVSVLRKHPRFAYFKIADIYQKRSVQGISEVLEAAGLLQDATLADAQETWNPAPAWKRWICGAAQAATVPWLVAMRMVQWLTPFFAYHFFTGDPGDSITRAVLLSVGVFLLLTVAEFAIAIIGKWLIAGRLKAGRYPLWGVTYFRWWLADRLVDAAPVYMLSGSALYSWWLRALGAKIGRDVMIGSITLRAPDLLSIGDGASIGNATNLENVRVQHGELLIGSINIAKDAYVGSYCVLEGNVTLEEGAHLEGQSALAEGQIIPRDRIWKGSPAKDVGAFDANAYPARPAYSKLRAIGENTFFIVGSLFISALFFMPVFPSFVTIDWFDNADNFPGCKPILFLCNWPNISYSRFRRQLF